MQRAATFLAFIISRKFSRVKRTLFFWLGENRPCRFSRDATPGFVVHKLKASLVKRALFSFTNLSNYGIIATMKGAVNSERG